MIMQFLDSLPETFASTRDTHSATGAVMQAALKLMVSRKLCYLYHVPGKLYSWVSLCKYAVDLSGGQPQLY